MNSSSQNLNQNQNQSTASAVSTSSSSGISEQLGGVPKPSYRQTFEQIVQALTQDAERESQNIQALQLMSNEMKANPIAFDDEDYRMVDDRIAERQEILNRITDDLNRRHQTYSNKVVVMENALETRETFFNSLDNSVIEQNKELFEALVLKQQNLLNLLETMKSELAEPLDNSNNNNSSSQPVK